MKKSPSTALPLGMPKSVIRGNIAYLIPVKLDPERCWLLERPYLEPGAQPGEKELILTPAAESIDPTEEEYYMHFLNRFGWKMHLTVPGRHTTTGREEYFWFPAPRDLSNTKQVLDIIVQQLKTVTGGPEQLRRLEALFQARKFHMTFTL